MLNIISHQEKVNQNHNEIHFRATRMTLIKSQTITSTGKEVEKLEHSYIVGRNGQPLLKSLQFLKRLNRVTIRPRNFIPRYTSKRNENIKSTQKCT